MPGTFENKAKALDLLLTHQISHRSLARAIAGTSPVTDASHLQMAISYLDFYGFLDHVAPGWENISLPDILAALKKFQEFVGLSFNPMLSAKELKIMNRPRCGMPDIETSPRHLAIKAWADTMLPAWRKRGLGYFQQSYVPGLSTTVQDQIIARAFAAWTQHGDIEVSRVNDQAKADIVIGTGQGSQDQFDGPGGILAWCYLPNGSDQQLQMKFDIAEQFITDPRQQGILMLNVATHELGHGLGLTHSRIGSALMAPYYNAAVATPQQADDIPRLVARYGARPTAVPDSPPAAAQHTIQIHYTGAAPVVTCDGKPLG